ncbi:hypothetical protein HK103_000050 [Boothiomyces macroporosus]|uniref:Uncharacterized protein n=1 Tax=Boothiomyces macroporosus TaxID=261099 RepID=A0AAD5USJ2_9FUNG|nr:hypothetical protein HK103_000050 [Boothiomyces macroporosus]
MVQAALPAGIVVPDGNELSIKLQGMGTQNYICNTTSGAFALDSVTSTLFKESTDFSLTPTAYYIFVDGKPTWISAADNSTITGAPQAKVPATNASFSVPNVLLKAVANNNVPGLFSGVSYFVRINTNGGQPPASCTGGQTAQVDYSADYWFYVPTGFKAPTVTKPTAYVVPTLTAPPNPVTTQYSIPTTLPLPAGNTLKSHYQGIGTQNYICDDKTSTFTLSNVTAALFKQGAEYQLTPSIQYVFVNGVPTWIAIGDKSTVSGTPITKVPSPDPANIPWVLLKSNTTNTPNGILNDVTFLARVNTFQGVPPSTCKSGEVAFVDYTADYYFYVANTSATATANNMPPPTYSPKVVSSSSTYSSIFLLFPFIFYSLL